MSSGSSHTCALRADGFPVCWDNYESGLSAPPPQGETFTAISRGSNHTCALRADGSPVCWGADHFGQASPPPGEVFTAISSGSYYTCALAPMALPLAGDLIEDCAIE